MDSNQEIIDILSFEVISDFPNSPFKIGDIISCICITYKGAVYSTGRPQEFVRDPDKYPNIFKKL